MARNLYIIEDEHGNWLHAHFSKESAKETIGYLRKFFPIDKNGAKKTYRIKTPRSVRIGKTSFPQDVSKLRWNKSGNDLVVVEETFGVVNGKPVKRNNAMMKKSVPGYLKNHAVVVNGIHDPFSGVSSVTMKSKSSGKAKKQRKSR